MHVESKLSGTAFPKHFCAHVDGTLCLQPTSVGMAAKELGTRQMQASYCATSSGEAAGTSVLLPRPAIASVRAFMPLSLPRPCLCLHASEECCVTGFLCRTSKVYLPKGPEQVVEQAMLAVQRAWQDGVKRQSLELLLPLIGATDLDDWCRSLLSLLITKAVQYKKSLRQVQA